MIKELQRQLAELPFRRSADSKLKDAAAGGDFATFQKRFLKAVSKPKKELGKLFKDSPALYSAALSWSGDADVQFSAKALSCGDDSNALAELLNSESFSPFQAVVASEWMLRYSSKASPEKFVQVLLRLAVFQASDEANHCVNESSPAGAESLISAAEAPVVVSLLLDCLKPSKVAGQRGRQNLNSLLDSATDTDGMLHGSLVASSFQFVAPLIRMLGWAHAFRSTVCSGRILTRLRQTLEQTIAMSDSSGCVLSNSAFPTSDQQNRLLLTGCSLAGMSKKSEAVQTLLNQSEERAKDQKKSKKSKVEPVAGNNQSDWAATAVLRSNLTNSADVIGLSWHDAVIHLGISAAGKRLMTGDWKFNISIDGVEHKPVGNWVCTCWFQDDDVAFVELEQGASGGTRHVRHIVLMLAEHVAILTDSVTCSDSNSTVDFASRLSDLQPWLGSLQVNPITRELRGGEQIPELRVVPAWLDDDRLIKASGDCSSIDGNLELTASGKGGVTVPLVFDWNPARKASEADWTKLSVTEDRALVGQRDASGFRIRLGRLQLLIYRSLRPGKTLRAVLGYNTANETVYGRFLNSGFVNPLVMVEAEA